ncbi:hypothetical protein SDJN02_17134, partial [Cucurbita argyrosperma subsp. argyrosperma]
MGNTLGGVCSNGIVKDDFVTEKKAKISEDRKGNSCLNPDASDPDELPLKLRSGVILLPSPPSKAGSNKVAPTNALGGARKAVDFLKTFGNSVSNMHTNSGFFTGMASDGREISILAFEVANTISKEFDVLLREVIRFGNRCKDPQWHNLDQFFSRLDLNDSTQKRAREARAAMQELTILAQFEQDYRRKVDEVEFMNQAGIGESLSIFQGELNVQRKLVRSFQIKGLWSRNLDEIVEKLVVVVTWINQAIAKAFGDKNTDKTLVIEERSIGQKLGSVGLALHYSNIISQINLIACRPTSIPSNMRDALYRALPTSVKTALRSRLQAVDASEEEPTYLGVKVEMDKILRWLVPIAVNTTKAHQACGRIGEWASQSKEQSKGRATQSNPIRLQTLYHADKAKTEQQIIELVTLLHHLIHLAKHQQQRLTSLRCRSPTPKEMAITQPNKARRIQYNSQFVKTTKDGAPADSNRPSAGQTPITKRNFSNRRYGNL